MTQSFKMPDTALMPFANSGIDAREESRSPEAVGAFLKDETARAAIYFEGKPALNEDFTLKLVKLSALKGANIFDPGPLFLGTGATGPLFAFSLEKPIDLTPVDCFHSLRTVGGKMPHAELSIAGRGRALLDWHRTHLFCASCGKNTYPKQSGLKRECNSCKTEHFPRVNPVVIMLITEGERCLLGRGPDWPDGFYSALAGFVSPGESIEEACAREVHEEVGIRVKNIEYVFSQPWPFPSQLMLGLICEAESSKITVNKTELDDAKWVSKDEMRAVFDKTGDAFTRPPRITIAHQLMKYWLAQEP